MLTSQAELEKRQLEKIIRYGQTGDLEDLPRPFKAPIDLTQLPHNHQKGKQCKGCRVLRKLSKDSKDKQIQSLTIEHGSDILKELILAGGYATGQAFNAVGQWARGYAENSDPVSQLATLGTGIVAFEWFKSSFPKLAKALHLDGLFFVAQGTGLPPEQPNGQYCVKITTLAGVQSHKCYATSTERDTAHTVLAGQSLGLYTVTDYQQLGGTALYCVRADGFAGAKVDQCFSTQQERDQFVATGLATHRIANPQNYDTVVPGSAPMTRPPHVP